MLFNKHLGSQVLNLETMEYEDDSVLVCFGGGGKGGSAPAPQRIIAPTPPIEEAGVVEDKDDKDILKSGKSRLKIPLSSNALFGIPNTSSTTTAQKTDIGLKV